jgi:hypothetical protein
MYTSKKNVHSSYKPAPYALTPEVRLNPMSAPTPNEIDSMLSVTFLTPTEKPKDAPPPTKLNAESASMLVTSPAMEPSRFFTILLPLRSLSRSSATCDYSSLAFVMKILTAVFL